MKTEVGRNIYLFHADKDVYNDECIISCHGGKVGATKFRPGATLQFYSDHGSTVRAVPLADFLSWVNRGPSTDPDPSKARVCDKGQECYDYDLSKFQGRHGNNVESYMDIDTFVTGGQREALQKLRERDLAEARRAEEQARRRADPFSYGPSLAELERQAAALEAAAATFFAPRTSAGPRPPSPGPASARPPSPPPSPKAPEFSPPGTPRADEAEKQWEGRRDLAEASLASRAFEKSTEYDVVTVRNRSSFVCGASELRLSDVVEQVLSVHPYKKIHCYFCRS